MNTSELPEAVAKLKEDLKKRVEQFNSETGLAVSGIIIEPRAVKDMGDKKVAVMYEVGVNIEL